MRTGTLFIGAARLMMPAIAETAHTCRTGARKENRQNRCENRDGRVGCEWATPMTPSVGSTVSQGRPSFSGRISGGYVGATHLRPHRFLRGIRVALARSCRFGSSSGFARLTPRLGTNPALFSLDRICSGQVPRHTCSCRFRMERGEHRCVGSRSLIDHDRSSMRAPDRLEGGQARLASRGREQRELPAIKPWVILCGGDETACRDPDCD